MSNILTLKPTDLHYPSKLFDLADPPRQIYYQGNIELLTKPMVAIVGSRNPSHQSLSLSYFLAYQLARRGFVIISGLARGVDTAAHTGAMAAVRSGSTVAVCGTPLTQVYPKENLFFQKEICKNHLCISEYAADKKVRPNFFVQRNRLIAALSQATIVTEAAPKSGSLITADFANELGREVMAIPGDVTRISHRGCHLLIQNGAKLVHSLEDILVELKTYRPSIHH